MAACPITIRFVAPQSLRTSYGHLRPGASSTVPMTWTDLAPMPLRVVPTEGGCFEVIDGFKRLNVWLKKAPEWLPVVVEQPGQPADDKRRLFLANAATRTLTAACEARIVASLKNDDGLSPGAVARFLGRKPHWVRCRLRLAVRLSEQAAQKLAHRKMGPTLALALCDLAKKLQNAVLACIERHALKIREAVRLVHAYVSADDPERKLLLNNPHEAVRPVPPSPTTSPAADRMERRIDGYGCAFAEFRELTISDEFAPAEQRRLQAKYRAAVSELDKTACAVLGAHHPCMEERHVYEHHQHHQQ